MRRQELSPDFRSSDVSSVVGCTKSVHTSKRRRENIPLRQGWHCPETSSRERLQYPRRASGWRPPCCLRNIKRSNLKTQSMHSQSNDSSKWSPIFTWTLTLGRGRGSRVWDSLVHRQGTWRLSTNFTTPRDLPLDGQRRRWRVLFTVD